MPLNVDRTSIGLAQAHLHEHALERPEARRAAAQQLDAEVSGDVALDVRVSRGEHEDVTHLARAEELVQRVLGDSISSLRNLHSGLDANRVAALLAD